MNTTDLIDFNNKKAFLHTYEIDSYAATLFWSKIKKVLNDIKTDFAEPVDWVHKLRVEGMKFRTSPYLPHSGFLEEAGITNLAALSRIWGDDISNSLSLIKIARDYLESNNVLLHQLLAKTLLEKIGQYGVDQVKIYCHAREVELYKSLDSYLTDNNFITSLSQYRVSDRFVVLFCVGPLKDFGWSRIPKIIVSSPRYSELIQFVWKGYSVSPDFGLDPLFNDINYFDRLFTTKKTIYADDSKSHFEQEEIDGDELDDQDVFSFKQLDSHENSSCYLIEINGGYGLLSAPGSNYIVFDGNGFRPNVFNEKTHNLISGQFIVVHDVNIDVGNFSNYSNKLSPLWKQALEVQYEYHWEKLMTRLKESKIELKNLDGCVQSWIKSEGATIRAPGDKRHFKILIDEILPENTLKGATWFDAWKEIDTSRRSAISEGQQESELINQEIVRKLKRKTQEISSLSSGKDYFRVRIDSDDGISGLLDFYQVKSLQEGYSAPREYFGSREKIEEFDVYRKVN